MRLARPAAVVSAGIAATLVAGVLAALPGAAAPAPAAAPPGVGSTIPQDVLDASAAPGHHWTPEAATYGVGKNTDLPVTMKDGTVLRADVYYPTAADGSRAKGSFPVHAHSHAVRQERARRVRLDGRRDRPQRLPRRARLHRRRGRRARHGRLGG